MIFTGDASGLEKLNDWSTLWLIGSLFSARLILCMTLLLVSRSIGADFSGLNKNDRRFFSGLLALTSIFCLFSLTSCVGYVNSDLGLTGNTVGLSSSDESSISGFYHRMQVFEFRTLRLTQTYNKLPPFWQFFIHSSSNRFR